MSKSFLKVWDTSLIKRLREYLVVWRGLKNKGSLKRLIEYFKCEETVKNTQNFERLS